MSLSANSLNSIRGINSLLRCTETTVTEAKQDNGIKSNDMDGVLIVIHI